MIGKNVRSLAVASLFLKTDFAGVSIRSGFLANGALRRWSLFVFFFFFFVTMPLPRNGFSMLPQPVASGPVSPPYF